MEEKLTEWFQKPFWDHNFVCLLFIIIIIKKKNLLKDKCIYYTKQIESMLPGFFLW